MDLDMVPEKKVIASGLVSAFSAALFLIIGFQNLRVARMTFTNVSAGPGYLLILVLSIFLPFLGLVLSIPRIRHWIDQRLELPWWGYAGAVAILFVVSYFLLVMHISVSTQIIMADLQNKLEAMNQTAGLGPMTG
ncbi:MAG: hypothetical protein ABEJ69_01905 [Candidatus Nanohaloarchaea archaeon]